MASTQGHVSLRPELTRAGMVNSASIYNSNVCHSLWLPYQTDVFIICPRQVESSV